MSLQVPTQGTALQLTNNTSAPGIMLPELTHEQLADSSPIDFVVSFINANPGVLLVEYVNSEYLPERLLFMKQSAMAKTNDAKLRLRLEAMMQQWNASANRRRPCSDRCRPAKTSALPLPSMGPLVKIFPKASTKSAATSSGRRLEPGSMRSVSQNARLGLGLTANMKKNQRGILNNRRIVLTKEALLPVSYLYKHVLKGFNRHGKRCLVVSLSQSAQQKMSNIRTHLHLSPSNKRHGSHQQMELANASALSILVKTVGNSISTKAIIEKMKNMRFPYHDGTALHLVIEDFRNHTLENAPTFMLRLSVKAVGRLYDTLHAFFNSQGYVHEKNIVTEDCDDVVKHKAYIQPESSPDFLWTELTRWNGENNAGKALMEIVLEVEPKNGCAICGPLNHQYEEANCGDGFEARGSQSIPKQECSEATLAAFERHLENRSASLNGAMVQVTRSREIWLGMTFIPKQRVVSIPVETDAAILSLFLCSDEWVEIDDFVRDLRR